MGPSQFNNNTYVVKEELTNEAIISMFGEESVESTIIPQAPQAPTSVKTYSGKITSLKPNQIFVFGSNEGGSKGQAPTHGAGAAKLAKDKFGAKQGQSRGIQGQSYAIVTKKFYDVKRSST
jgi:hypothetical protein